MASVHSTKFTLLTNSTDSMVTNTDGISTSDSVSFAEEPTLLH